MNFLGTLAQWAKDAWNAIGGAAGDVVGALQKVWSYITSLHSLLSWVVGFPVLQVLRAIHAHSTATSDALAALLAAIARLKNWIWAHEVNPVRLQLLAAIAALKAWTQVQIGQIYLAMYRDLVEALSYTRFLVGVERLWRIQAINREHAAMLAQIRALHQLIEREAASGYNTGTPDRKSVIQKLLTDLAERDPAIKGLVGELVRIVIDIDTIDNPVIRFLAGKLLSDIVAHLGIDQAISDLISRLLGPLAGQPKATGLYDVEKDVARRLTALEDQWAAFMHDGGPELEQAGRGWKDLGSLGVDAAILGFVGLAVRNPQQWSTAVNDTIGIAAGDAMTGIVRLIDKA